MTWMKTSAAFGLMAGRFFSPVALLVGLVFPLMAQPSDPPHAEIRPLAITTHGDAREDPYFWLREREDPAVRAYLEAENAYSAAFFAPLQDLRETLVAELKHRLIEEDTSVPYRRGEWLYYAREVAGKDHSLICRKKDESGDEVVVFDLNERAAGDPAFTFGGGAVSPDGWLYAWKENFVGDDIYTVRSKNLRTGEILADEIAGSSDGTVVWARDNQTFFYTQADEAQRPWRVYRHQLGADPAEDVRVFEESDPEFRVDIERTKSDRFLLITSGAKDTTETRMIPLDQPGQAPVSLAPRREGIRYAFADFGEEWYILTNDGAIDGRLLRAPLAPGDPTTWTEVLPGAEGVAYNSVDAFQTHLVLSARREGVTGMFVLDPVSGKSRPNAARPHAARPNAARPNAARPNAARWITSPQPGAWFSLEATPEPSSTAQRVSYETMLDPYTVADVDLATGEFTILKQKSAPADYDRTKYRVERSEATASDGTKLPIWLLLPRDASKDGSGAILLDGYGAYGIPSDPYFNSNVLSLVDRGIGFAVAQIRGGGEFGRAWYEAGKMEHKQNSFDDFIACAEHLIAEGYTSPAQLAGTGASAGGLLAGGVLNQRPDLFRAYVADVPFVDALNTMLDPTLPLTTEEYTEWGNPTDSVEAYQRIKGYAPYENVKAQDYPAIFVLAGWNDSRVPYWEAAKWVARLRATKTDDRPLLLDTQFETGHGGASGRYQALEETALQYAFLISVLGR